jgi:hypothetical protein
MNIAVKKNVSRIAIGGTLCGLVVALSPGIALASRIECSFYFDDPQNCVAQSIPANSRYHAIYLNAYAYSADKVECRAYDTGNNQVVGRVSDTKGGTSTIIRGLYGTYYVGCGNVGSNEGSGGGYIENSDSFVD